MQTTKRINKNKQTEHHRAIPGTRLERSALTERLCTPRAAAHSPETLTPTLSHRHQPHNSRAGLARATARRETGRQTDRHNPTHPTRTRDRPPHAVQGPTQQPSQRGWGHSPARQPFNGCPATALAPTFSGPPLLLGPLGAPRSCLGHGGRPVPRSTAPPALAACRR